MNRNISRAQIAAAIARSSRVSPEELKLSRLLCEPLQKVWSTDEKRRAVELGLGQELLGGMAALPRAKLIVRSFPRTMLG